MKILERIKAFVDLGIFFQDFSNLEKKHKIFDQSFTENHFFIKENICYAFKSLSNMLEHEKLEKWILSYKTHKMSCKSVGVICAGNIPLVCFHDILCVLILGNKLYLKPSSKDYVLISFVINKLLKIEPRFKDLIFLSENIINADIIICTGNNISANYFNYYFKQKPKIIRSSRSSVAILSGQETESELQGLSKDVFLYFGLGCRNVTKIYIPKGYDISILKPYFLEYRPNLNCKNYYDNYIYNKAILLLNKTTFFDFQNILILESEKNISPISMLFYEYYNIKEGVDIDNSNVQCIVSNNNKTPNAISFGQSQSPELFDYADNIDTIQFLISNS
jgi:hypothetical protein